MKIKNIFYSDHFAETFCKIPEDIKKHAIQIEKTFRNDCFSQSLKTTSLNNLLKDLWSLKLTNGYAILFEFQAPSQNIGFIDIANHSIYNQHQ